MRVLIVDDDAISRRLMETSMSAAGYDVIALPDGIQAWQRLQHERFPMVIVDWMMPGMDGIELVRNIRSKSSEHYVYTILLTGRSERKDRLEGFRAGVDDYITKPFDRDELIMRCRAGERVVRLEEELASKNAQLLRMAMVDGLTGIGNRRAFDQAFQNTYAQASRYHQLLGLALIDVDHFKSYNDLKGHKAGDEVLQRVAAILDQGVRKADSVFRYGGEEFACLFPVTGAFALRDRSARIAPVTASRTTIRSTRWSPSAPPSSGITALRAESSFNPPCRSQRSSADRVLSATRWSKALTGPPAP